jgi:hypothetical protein
MKKSLRKYASMFGSKGNDRDRGADDADADSDADRGFNSPLYALASAEAPSRTSVVTAPTISVRGVGREWWWVGSGGGGGGGGVGIWEGLLRARVLLGGCGVVFSSQDHERGPAYAVGLLFRKGVRSRLQ